MQHPLSDAALEVLRGLRAEVRQHHPRGRLLLAVDGMDGAGKTTFADAFAEVLREDGSVVFRASIDGFHRPRVQRYARGRASAEGFYRDSYDLDAFRAELVHPFRAGEPFRTAVHDVETDLPVDVAPQTAPADAILLVDGIFLLRPELRDLWAWSVWLDVPVDVAYERMAARDGSDPDHTALANARYRQGHELYLREADPRTRAAALVDNTDPAHPVREFRDFC